MALRKTMKKCRLKRITIFLASALCALSAATTVIAQDRTEWSVTSFGAVMTNNQWEEVFQPWEIDFIDSQLVGIALGREWPLSNSRWTVGFEAQVVKHFGRQDHLEFNLPVIARYHPKDPWIASIESLSFGLGPSHATEIPQTEIDRDGASRRNLIYWMAEVEFATVREGRTWLIRVHHRSDAYGLVKPPAGSNAIAIGVRQAF